MNKNISFLIEILNEFSKYSIDLNLFDFFSKEIVEDKEKLKELIKSFTIESEKKIIDTILSLPKYINTKEFKIRIDNDSFEATSFKYSDTGEVFSVYDIINNYNEILRILFVLITDNHWDLMIEPDKKDAVMYSNILFVENLHDKLASIQTRDGV